ncbi:MAG: 30S ribosomal protein S3ae [Candidatus Hydrothermarchaeota archaeon]|mgnify:CR=1 FL=1|jgi:small subunit ribosomal protein S3Ae|nr:30S ribosomal protein S3ae [Candidatus Hydrothermarchaeota archaeon]
MAKAKKRKKIDTWKTKKWYEVFTTKMFGEAKIGDALASDPAALKGRVVEATVRDLTGDFSKQHIKLEFQIEDVRGDKAYAKFKSHSLSRDYMRSQIRRKTTRMEGVTDVTTKDGHMLRVKTIALARGRAQTAQEKTIRKIMSNRVFKTANKVTLDQFIQEVVLGRIATDMYKAANKIYPLKRVEVRKVKMLGTSAKAHA